MNSLLTPPIKLRIPRKKKLSLRILRFAPSDMIDTLTLIHSYESLSAAERAGIVFFGTWTYIRTRIILLKLVFFLKLFFLLFNLFCSCKNCGNRRRIKYERVFGENTVGVHTEREERTNERLKKKTKKRKSKAKHEKTKAPPFSKFNSATTFIVFRIK